jgi:hypothetical protein
MLAPFGTRSTGILVLPGKFWGRQVVTLPVILILANNRRQQTVTQQSMQAGQKSGRGPAA